MNKRLAMLEKLVSEGNADSFARYALAMEYRKQGRRDEALATFEALRAVDADYLAQYLMAAQILIESGRGKDAREWLDAGIVLATRVGDQRTLSELRDALAET
jgi:predicted Zn-dependent protease